MPHTFTLTVPDPDIGQIDPDVYGSVAESPEYMIWKGCIEIECIEGDLAEAVDAWVRYGIDDYTLVACVLRIRNVDGQKTAKRGVIVMSKFNSTSRQWTPWEEMR